MFSYLFFYMLSIGVGSLVLIHLLLLTWRMSGTARPRNTLLLKETSCIRVCS